MNSTIFRGLCAAFGLCLLVIGFQNCGHFTGGDDWASAAQLSRSLCVVAGDVRCDKGQDFVMAEKSQGVLDDGEAVLVDPSQTVFLYASLGASSAVYKWYNSDSLNAYDSVKGLIEGDRLTRGGRAYQLPACSGDLEAPRNEMSKNTLHFFHVEALHEAEVNEEDSSFEEANFLVACVEKREASQALSEDDDLASAEVLRQYCVLDDEGDCDEAEAYQLAGDLILIHAGERIRLKMGLEGAASYSWYVHDDARVDCDQGQNACRHVRDSTSANLATAPSLDIAFSGDEQPALGDACGANKVVYFHAVATKSEGGSKHRAIFRVACL